MKVSFSKKMIKQNAKSLIWEEGDKIKTLNLYYFEYMKTSNISFKKKNFQQLLDEQLSQKQKTLKQRIKLFKQI